AHGLPLASGAFVPLRDGEGGAPEADVGSGGPRLDRDGAHESYDQPPLDGGRGAVQVPEPLPPLVDRRLRVALHADHDAGGYQRPADREEDARLWELRPGAGRGARVGAPRERPAEPDGCGADPALVAWALVRTHNHDQAARVPAARERHRHDPDLPREADGECLPARLVVDGRAHVVEAIRAPDAVDPVPDRADPVRHRAGEVDVAGAVQDVDV